MRALFTGTFLVAALAALTAGCGGAPPTGADSDVVESTESALSSRVAADLVFIRQEEKMARDVYLALGEKWGLPIFSNISQSEQVHMDVMLSALNRYGVADPVASAPRGVFVDATVQGLYDDLVARGQKSLIDALLVGAEIEDFDIVDIQTRLGSSPPSDIRTIYLNLMKASRNHLRSFAGQLANRGASYTPQFLTPEAYQQIISTPRERGPY